MVELRAALTLLLDRLELEMERRIRAGEANEGLNRAITVLRAEADVKDARAAQLSTSLSLRLAEIAQATDHLNKQEDACFKLYESVENLLRSLPVGGKWDHAEIDRRGAIVKANLATAFPFCNQVPF